jgi:hypothetical protein
LAVEFFVYTLSSSACALASAAEGGRWSRVRHTAAAARRREDARAQQVEAYAPVASFTRVVGILRTNCAAMRAFSIAFPSASSSASGVGGLMCHRYASQTKRAAHAVLAQAHAELGVFPAVEIERFVEAADGAQSARSPRRCT